MNTKLLVRACLSLAFTSPVALRAGADDAAPAAETKAEGNAPADKPAAKKKVVEKGMTAAEITALFGKPAEIKPMKAPDPATTAEQWIYRRKAKETTVQSADSAGTMPAMIRGGGDPSNIVEVPTVRYHVKHVVVYQVTALLMVNGKLELAKQWAEKEEAYTD